MKALKSFIAVLSVILVVAAVALFFNTEAKSQKLSDTKSQTEAMLSIWEKQNNCEENPAPCESYKKQISDWLVQFEQYKESTEVSLEFRYYSFLKNLDNSLFPSLNAGGLFSLVIVCVIVLIVVFLLLYLLKSKGKHSPFVVKTGTKTVASVANTAVQATQKSETVKHTEAEPQPQAKSLKVEDILLVLNKASQCAESEPMQAISYLEQALSGSLGSKLTAPALLLCGTLRLKNNIGAEEGKAQLEKIISDYPNSAEAQKAQTAIDSFP